MAALDDIVQTSSASQFFNEVLAGLIALIPGPKRGAEEVDVARDFSNGAVGLLDGIADECGN